MLFNLPSNLLFLILTPLPSDASLLVGNVVHKAHHLALRHSAGLARDLRTTFKGILLSQPVSQPGHQVYCTSSKGLHRGGSSGSTGSSNGTTSRMPAPMPSTATQTGSTTKGISTTTADSSVVTAGSNTGSQPAPTQAASPWNLFESHVGNTIVLCT
jgi:hypothetical protein